MAIKGLGQYLWRTKETNCPITSCTPVFWLWWHYWCSWGWTPGSYGPYSLVFGSML